MKKHLLLILLSFIFIETSTAQESSTGTTVDSFFEWSFGVAYVDSAFPAPGTALLWGKTFTKENTIFEYEAGFALPTG